MAIWNILWRFGIFYDLLLHLVFIWYIFSGFGIMYQEKSGNPADNQSIKPMYSATSFGEMSLFGKIVQTFFKNYHPEPWRDSIS
jgi:hypothetical protein